MVISTSFWGFERPLHLPPNFILTGPLLSNNAPDQLELLRRKALKLSEWLDEAELRQEPVIYISIGTEC